MISTASRLASICVCIGVLVLQLASPPAAAQDTFPDTTSKEFLANCRSKFAEVDAAISHAGAGYAGYHRIKGFPYLRSDRMLAAFGDKVSSFEAFDIWTYELRENDGFARSVELANMGMPDVERSTLLTDLRLCAVWLSNQELADSDTLQKVYQEAQLPSRTPPPDLARMRALDRAIQRQQAAIKSDLSRDGKPATTKVAAWVPRQVTHSMEPPRLLQDPLGRIGYTPTDWQEMAEQLAPRWLIETAGTFDSIGAPAWSADGKAIIDPRRHLVYYMPSYARVQGRTLVQIVYFVWFSERVSTSHMPDLLAGKIDGLMWRVTLDPSGHPLLFDSMHMSGFDQIWFVPDSVTRKNTTSRDEDPLLVVPVVSPEPHMAVRVHSGSHSPWRIVEESTAPEPADIQEYELVRYDDLMTLPIGGNRTKSFFDARGIVPGSERTSPIPSAGMANAGAIREWGNHPTAITGRHYFDDPGLIEHFFVLPIGAQEQNQTDQPAEPEPMIIRSGGAQDMDLPAFLNWDPRRSPPPVDH